MFENNKLLFAKCFAKIILQYVPEGSGSWKYNHYFPVAKGEGKIAKSAVESKLEHQAGLNKAHFRKYSLTLV